MVEALHCNRERMAELLRDSFVKDISSHSAGLAVSLIAYREILNYLVALED